MINKNAILDKILVGSYYFFKDYEDYKLKDYDYIVFCDKEKVSFDKFITEFDKDKKEDCFYTTLTTKEDFLKYLDEEYIYSLGKFLIPEFNKKIKFTMKDLKSLKDKYDLLRGKFLYLKVIYDGYIENKKFVLTPEQRDAAYKIYKKYRRKRYFNLEQHVINMYYGIED